MRRNRRDRGPLPLLLPRLDGRSWPSADDVGRDSFAASTLYQLGYREAFSPEAHRITDALLDEVLPLLPTGAAEEDAPHLRGVLSAAAQIGAGIGVVERGVAPSSAPATDRQVAGALRVAADDLPPMPAGQHLLARFLLQCGYYLARTDLDRIPEILLAVRADEEPLGGPEM
jgi:hypothetical protein